MFTRQEILSKTDHTLLRQDATAAEVRALCEDALRFQTASVCIPPRFVKTATDLLGGQLPVCTVIGFALGYSTLKSKCFETQDALENGATEIDMVIPAGAVKAGAYDEVKAEIRALKALCEDRILKVIVETCLLSQTEKVTLCKLVEEMGADFIKTSTGFAGGGAKAEDIRLFATTCPNLKIKASGGIRTFEAAQELLAAGACRLGASALVELCK